MLAFCRTQWNPQLFDGQEAAVWLVIPLSPSAEVQAPVVSDPVGAWHHGHLDRGLPVRTPPRADSSVVGCPSVRFEQEKGGSGGLNLSRGVGPLPSDGGPPGGSRALALSPVEGAQAAAAACRGPMSVGKRMPGLGISADSLLR